jgi:hypothetical protein
MEHNAWLHGETQEKFDGESARMVGDKAALFQLSTEHRNCIHRRKNKRKQRIHAQESLASRTSLSE